MTPETLDRRQRATPAEVHLSAGEPAKGDFRCADCGYGIAAFHTLPSCPMCRGESWVASAWSPVAGRLRASDLL
jgi:rubrerythrin